MSRTKNRGLRFLPVYTALAVPVALAGLVWVMPYGAPAQDASQDKLRPYLWQAGMPASEIGEVNLFRRFSADAEHLMRVFYADVLKLGALPTQSSGGGQMIRHPIGRSEVKLFPVAPREPSHAPVTGRVGVVLLTLFFADQAELEARFAKHGFTAPEFRAVGGRRAALTRDPDGEWVELVVVPDADPADLARFEIGLGAADLDATRAFYRDLMGLQERGPERHALLGVDMYSYRHRDSTLKVWAAEAGAELDSETAGMQYIVWNVEAVNDVALARGANIDRPLSDPGTMRTVWLRDPNGVSNYFAQFAGHDNRPPGH